MTFGDDTVQRRHFVDGEHAGVSAMLSRRLLEDVRHGADLARLADDVPARWTDALRAETRFHLAGLMNAVEIAITLELAENPVTQLLDQLGSGHARVAIEGQMSLLSPALVAHLRRRAAVSLLLRHNQLPGGRASLAVVEGEAVNERYLDGLAALGLAERHWYGPMLLDAPMRPDLPAEHYHDLVWTVTALLIRGCERLAGGTDQLLINAFARASSALIARHDEGQGAVALAQRCARSLPSYTRFALAPAALMEARLLLFAAFVECETGLGLEEVLEALTGDNDGDRFALMRLMGVKDDIVFRTAELLAPVTGLAERGDIALAEFVEGYRAFEAPHAADWLIERITPRALTEKLASLDRLK